jgi:hypothetical protein
VQPRLIAAPVKFSTGAEAAFTKILLSFPPSVQALFMPVLGGRVAAARPTYGWEARDREPSISLLVHFEGVQIYDKEVQLPEKEEDAFAWADQQLQSARGSMQDNLADAMYLAGRIASGDDTAVERWCEVMLATLALGEKKTLHALVDSALVYGRYAGAVLVVSTGSALLAPIVQHPRIRDTDASSSDIQEAEIE